MGAAPRQRMSANSRLTYGGCEISVRPIIYDVAGRRRHLGYKALCHTHWAESPLCSTRMEAVDAGIEHADAEHMIERFKKTGAL